MAEVLRWPVIVGGPGDGELVPDDRLWMGYRVLPPEQEDDTATYTGRIVHYTEMLLVLIPGELAIRFLMPRNWDKAERQMGALRALVNRALGRRIDPGADVVTLFGYDWVHSLRGLLDEHGPARLSAHPQDGHDMVLEWPAGQPAHDAPLEQYKPKRLELRIP